MSSPTVSYLIFGGLRAVKREGGRGAYVCRFSSLYITWLLACKIGIGIGIGIGAGRDGVLTMMIDIVGLFLPLRRRRQGCVIMIVVMIILIMIILLLEQVYPFESRGEVNVVREAHLAVHIRIDRLDNNGDNRSSNESNGVRFGVDTIDRLSFACRVCRFRSRGAQTRVEPEWTIPRVNALGWVSAFGRSFSTD